MIPKANHNDKFQKTLLHFIFSGSSALILSFAHIYSEYWFVYLFALVPFLWRVSRTDLTGAVVSGFFLAGCYIFVVYIGEVFIYAEIFIIRFIFLSTAFMVFAIAVNLLKKKRFFNPAFIALLWLPFEYIHSHYIGSGGIFNLQDGGSGIVWRIMSLYGFLMVTFVVVAVNTLILLMIESFCKLSLPGFIFLFQFRKLFFFENDNIVFIKHRNFLPDLRGPPALALNY